MRVPRSSAAPLRAAGFSLLELVVVLLILLVLTVLYLNGAPGRRQQGQMANCRNQLHFIHQALATFANENSGRLPFATNASSSDQPLSLLVPAHTTRTASFICPGTRHRKPPDAQPFAGRKISYAYAMGLTSLGNGEQWLLSDAQVNALAKTNGQPLFSASGQAPGHNHGRFGGNVLFADGRAEFSPTNAAFDIRLPRGVTLFNPRP